MYIENLRGEVTCWSSTLLEGFPGKHAAVAFGTMVVEQAGKKSSNPFNIHQLLFLVAVACVACVVYVASSMGFAPPTMPFTSRDSPSRTLQLSVSGGALAAQVSYLCYLAQLPQSCLTCRACLPDSYQIAVVATTSSPVPQSSSKQSTVKAPSIESMYFGIV